MVKVERSMSIDIEYLDERGVKQQWTNIDQALSELLQHEIDHLDGKMFKNMDAVLLCWYYLQLHPLFKVDTCHIYFSFSIIFPRMVIKLNVATTIFKIHSNFMTW